MPKPRGASPTLCLLVEIQGPDTAARARLKAAAALAARIKPRAQLLAFSADPALAVAVAKRGAKLPWRVLPAGQDPWRALPGLLEGSRGDWAALFPAGVAVDAAALAVPADALRDADLILTRAAGGAWLPRLLRLLQRLPAADLAGVALLRRDSLGASLGQAGQGGLRLLRACLDQGARPHWLPPRPGQDAWAALGARAPKAPSLPGLGARLAWAGGALAALLAGLGLLRLQFNTLAILSFGASLLALAYALGDPE